MDYHVLQGNKTGNEVTYGLVFHIPVASALNFVGVNYRELVARFQASVSAVDNITATEQANLNAGLLYEDRQSFKTHINGSGYVSQVAQWYSDRKAFLTSQFIHQFKFSGREANI